ncbi:MAG: hypothetical protein H7144_03555 [Burkholderiales bacterium]|nr:hypothetical protein [Phycisphaerae bacterium]
MEFSYTTSAKDYLALLQHHLERSVIGKHFVQFAWIAIASLAWLSVLLPFLKFGVIDLGFIIRAAFAAFITLGFPFLYRWYNDSVFGLIINERSVKGIAGLTSLTANAEFIEQKTAMTTARAAWCDVVGITSTKHHDFISLAPLVTIMVPASAFSNADARNAFRTQLEHWRTAAGCEAMRS